MIFSLFFFLRYHTRDKINNTTRTHTTKPTTTPAITGAILDDDPSPAPAIVGEDGCIVLVEEVRLAVVIRLTGVIKLAEVIISVEVIADVLVDVILVILLIPVVVVALLEDMIGEEIASLMEIEIVDGLGVANVVIVAKSEATVVASGATVVVAGSSSAIKHVKHKC